MSKDIWLYIDAAQAGGIEVHVQNLAQSLCNTGRECQVVLHKDHGQKELCAAIQSSGVRLRVLDGCMSALWHAAKADRPALIHTHGYKAGILGRLTARLLGIPVVSTFHSGDPGTGKVRIYSLLDRYTAFLGRSLAVNQLIAETIPGGAKVIPNFVSIPAASAGVRDLDCCFVGRLEAEKGPDIFCELVSQLPGDIQGHVFGDGQMRKALEYDFPHRPEFHGLIYPLDQWWPRINLLCVTSRFEGLPYAVLEAMSHGVAVAAFGVGALPELIQDGINGFIVNPGEIDSLENAILKWQAFSEEEKTNLRAAARQTIADNFSDTVVLRQILAVYDQAISHRSSQ